MTSLKSSQGTERILLKLKKLVEDGEFYEAHQMYRTIYFRYLNSKRFHELRELLYDGALLFLNKNQSNSGADLAALYLDVISKDAEYGQSLRDNEKEKLFSEKLGELLSLIPQHSPERGKYIMIALKLEPDIFPLPSIHNQFALILWREKNYPEARYHFLQSASEKGGEDCAHMLIEHHINSGYPSEVDLFIAQFILQLLCIKNKNNHFQQCESSNSDVLSLADKYCRSDQHAFANKALQCYAAKHPLIQKNNPPFILPLLNFLWLLLIAINNGKSGTFKTLCDLYGTSLKRDPSYNDYLMKIGQIYFGLQDTTNNRSGNFLNNFFQSLMEDDQEQSTPSNNRHMGRKINKADEELD